MGVNGLTPFLQKICPDVIKRLPNRLQTLQGKRIVLDGTLFTARFHYNPSPMPYRHILGWYRLAKELSANGISAICIFDGGKRTSAKAREAERRLEVRQLATVRGTLEEDRFNRLDKLKAGFQQLQKLDKENQRLIWNSLKESSALKAEVPIVKEPVVLEPRKEAPPPEPIAKEPTTTTPEPVAREAGKEEAPPLEPKPILEVVDVVGKTPSQLAGELAVFLKNLNVGYQATLSKLSLLSPEVPKIVKEELILIPPDVSELKPELAVGVLGITPVEEPVKPIPPLEEQVERFMSKAQFELTAQEGEIWQEMLAQSLESEDPKRVAVVEEKIDVIRQKSHFMMSSFHRRTNHPTGQTFKEAKEILQAMGIPCLNASDTFEAEALASAIVLEGMADYVASEDTDVLVYGAPLIRNLTTRNVPLLIISAADIREQLGLNHDSYIDFALLLGTDFSQRIKNIGPVRALDLIKTHGSIERVIEVIEKQPKYKPRLPPDAYLAQVEIARLVFRNLPPVPPLPSFEVIQKNDDKVENIFQRHGLDISLLERDDWDYDSNFQTTLGGNFFGDNPSAL